MLYLGCKWQRAVLKVVVVMAGHGVNTNRAPWGSVLGFLLLYLANNHMHPCTDCRSTKNLKEVVEHYIHNRSLPVDVFVRKIAPLMKSDEGTKDWIRLTEPNFTMECIKLRLYIFNPEIL